MLQAVSAVDIKGRPAALQRPGAWASLAASSVQFQPQWPGTSMLPRSGTSIATAVATGMAIRVLDADRENSTNPTNPTAVAARLSAFGQSIVEPASGPNQGKTILATVCANPCRAVRALGLPPIEDVPKLTPRPPEGDIERQVAQCPGEIPSACGSNVKYLSSSCPPAGRVDEHRRDANGPYCANEEMLGRESVPSSGPQPENPLCPHCFFLDGQFYWTFDSAYANNYGIYGTLKLVTTNSTIYVDLASEGVDPMEPNQSGDFHVALGGETVVSASLTYIDNDFELSHLEEIAID